MGRIVKYHVDLGWKMGLRILAIYGKSGERTEAILVFESVMDAIIEEMHAEPYTPTMMVGDFNVEPKKLANVKELI